ncbi:MAG TPA: type II toxin-antitoxin system VapC family toxin [Spirochaetota bacterium]|nr:type II toxin-antitoxin system VapC family toxin [Spirochaetota bacterium]HOS40976.1 type II toxin-antitoxin system VapC family toxin [Spirochaetota bacterium]HPU90098.1 type II toxin-antitoxin system VapC family toxin [Spirochaetota bacterium]
MRLYIDTSALLKRYVSEEGSDRLDAIMGTADEIVVSAITELELCSALRRLLANRVVNADGYRTVLNEFGTDYPSFVCVPFDDVVADNAKALIDAHQLRTLDSIQLGAALAVRDEIDCFVACDAKLATAARKAGLKVFNPLS